MEMWAKVREFPEHYEISTAGRLRGIRCYRPSDANRIRKPQKDKRGYVVYLLSVNNKPILRYAHRMVADAFLGPIPSGMQVNHKNGDKGDPNLENLEIVTNAENRAHSYRVLGIRPNSPPKGQANHKATLSFEQVEEIRRRYLAGNDSYSSLSKEFGVSKQSIARYVKGQIRTGS